MRAFLLLHFYKLPGLAFAAGSDDNIHYEEGNSTICRRNSALPVERVHGSSSGS